MSMNRITSFPVFPLLPALTMFISILLGSGCASEHHLDPSETRFGVLDLAPSIDDLVDDRVRTEREATCGSAINALGETVPGLHFEAPLQTQGWYERGDLEPLSVADGALRTRVYGEGGRIIRVIDDLSADQASQMMVELSVDGGGQGRFLWRNAGEESFSDRNVREFDLRPGGRPCIYWIRLGKSQLSPLDAREWAGTVDAVMLDFPGNAGKVSLHRFELVRGASRSRIVAERVRHGLENHVVLSGVSRPILPVDGNTGKHVRIPDGCSLSAHMGVMGHAWEGGASGGATHFRVLFLPRRSGGTEPLVLYHGTLSPVDHPRHRGWVPLRLDLADLAGFSGELVFQSGEVRDGRVDWGSWSGGVWGNPLLAVAGGAAGKEAGDSPANVLIISLDTLRADRMSGYGNSRFTTAQIDRRLIRRGTQFSVARTSSPWTLPAHFSLMTGIDTIQEDVNLPGRLPRNVATLAGQLKRAGYRTAAITGGGYVAPEWGFDRGFDLYATETDLGEAVTYALDVTRQSGASPFFLFLHTYETHAPYTPREPYISQYEPKPYRGALQATTEELLRVNNGIIPVTDEDVDHLKALYDSGVAYTDHQIGRLLSALTGFGLEDRTIVVLLSDHGEEFVDHGSLDHGRSLYEELLRIPLTFCQPGRIASGVTIDEPVSLVDVFPTILELAGVDRPAGLSGCSLAGLLVGNHSDCSLPERITAAVVTYPFYGDRKYALLQGGRKVIFHPDDGREEYFDLENDPQEANAGNGAAVDERNRVLMAMLKQRLAAGGSNPEQAAAAGDSAFSPRTRDRLQQLGYLE